MDQLLQNYKLAKLNENEIEKLSNPVTILNNFN